MGFTMLGENFANQTLAVGFGTPAPSWVKDTAVHLSAHTAYINSGSDFPDPGDPDWFAFEVTAADYSRVAVSQDDIVVEDGRVLFPAVTFTASAANDWGTIQSIGCWRTNIATGETDLLFAMNLDFDVDVLTGYDFLFRSGDLEMRIDRSNVYGVQPSSF